MTTEIPERLPPEFFKQPLTARALEDFSLCPRKFLLSFISTDTDARRLRGGPAALHQAVRQALLDLYQRGAPATWSQKELLNSFAEHWQGGWCADALEEQQLHQTGQDLLQHYHQAHATDTRAVLATDLRLTATLGGQEFLAVADLVLAGSDNNPEVIRFVTSRRPLSAAELADDLSAQLLWLLAQAQYTETEPLVFYHALREDRLREVTLSSDQATRITEELPIRVGRIRREEEFAPRRGSHCRWCRSRSRCPLWRR